MKERHLGWPTYLALLVGITLIVEWLFEVIGLSAFDLTGAAIFIVLMMIFDFFTGATPSQEQRKGGHNG